MMKLINLLLHSALIICFCNCSLGAATPSSSNSNSSRSLPLLSPTCDQGHHRGGGSGGSVQLLQLFWKDVRIHFGPATSTGRKRVFLSSALHAKVQEKTGSADAKAAASCETLQVSDKAAAVKHKL